MLGLAIGAWSAMPVEAVCVWFAVSFTTVITYEVIKISGTLAGYGGAVHPADPGFVSP